LQLSRLLLQGALDLRLHQHRREIHLAEVDGGVHHLLLELPPGSILRHQFQVFRDSLLKPVEALEFGVDRDGEFVIEFGQLKLLDLINLNFEAGFLTRQLRLGIVRGEWKLKLLLLPTLHPHQLLGKAGGGGGLVFKNLVLEALLIDKGLVLHLAVNIHRHQVVKVRGAFRRLPAAVLAAQLLNHIVKLVANSLWRLRLEPEALVVAQLDNGL